MSYKRLIGGAVLFGLLAACALPRSYHAVSYKNRQVILDRRYRYGVGPLPADWVYRPTKKPGILFVHKKNRATIFTNALCGGAYEDLSLKMLTGHLFAGLTDVRKVKEKKILLSGREALYTRARAKLDGVETELNIVVLKKNRCQFDFTSVTIVPYAEAVGKDFVSFVKGFQY